MPVRKCNRSSEHRGWMQTIGAAGLALVVLVATGCGRQSSPQKEKLLKDANSRLSKAASEIKSIRPLEQVKDASELQKEANTYFREKKLGM
ncbi:MAG: hypothetical protein ACYC99_11095 [Candidatus Geothermincolia bacterium]